MIVSNQGVGQIESPRQQILHATFIEQFRPEPLHFGNDCVGGGDRIGRSGDWPSDDEILAPAAIAAAGVATRFDLAFACRGSDSGCDDEKLGIETACRMVSISCGEATTPSTPAASASLTSRSTDSQDWSYADLREIVASMLVRTLIASTFERRRLSLRLRRRIRLRGASFRCRRWRES